jgi:hypothetical protein
MYLLAFEFNWLATMRRKGPGAGLLVAAWQHGAKAPPKQSELGKKIGGFFAGTQT